ncbi:MAG: AraC family transcriptional regulator [Nocardioides sp.]|nr:AraC family transcriptional regulator [Nocardioides sp.]
MSAPVSEESLEAFSAQVAGAYFPHRLDVRRAPGLAPDLRSVDLGPVRLARIGWGADVAVESDHPGAWAINVPRSGVLEARVGGRTVTSLDGQATVCPPDEPTRMTRWSADCRIVGMRVEKDYLADQVGSLVGLPASRMPRQLDVRTEAGRAWLDLLSGIGTELMRNPGLAADPAVALRLGSVLTAALVGACFPEADRCGEARPRIVSRVLDAIEADPARDWTAADLAEEAGVGVRRLQQGFRRYVGCTPGQAVQAARLERAHADLLAGDAETVAEVAYRWGFGHLGRFAAAYRERYGVAPSRTLHG